jgi:hypothetical protein
MNTDKVMLDPKLAERLQAKNYQMIVFIVAAAIFAIGASAKLFHDWNLLHSWMIYIPLALGVAIGYFGQGANQRRIKRIYAEGTRSVIEEVKDYVSKIYGITLNEDPRLETIRVGEKEKIRINPLSLSATDIRTGADLRIAVTFRPDYKAVIIRTLTNDEWFDEAAKISNSDSALF